MIYTKRLIAFLILVCMLTASLIACDKTGNADVTTANSTNEAVATPDPAQDTVLKLVENGKVNFNIVRPASSEEEFAFEFFTDVKNLIESTLGIKVETAYEETDGCQIFIGSKEFSTYESLADTYKSKDSFFGVCENKLVIYGATNAALNKSFKQFEKLLKEKATADKSNISFSSDENYSNISSNYMVNTLKIGDTSLRKFCIVYPAEGRYSEELFALKLKEIIEKRIGYSLEVYTDKKSLNNAKKIIIGKTVYSSDVTTSGYDYSLQVKQGNLILAADSIEGYDSLLSYFSNAHLSDKDVVLEEGLTTTKTVAADKVSIKTEKLGDVRIVINNILGNCDDSIYPVSYRTKSVMEMLTSYSPDVLGLQECSPKSRSTNIVGVAKKYGYEEVSVEVTNSKKSNYTPLFYNPKTVKVIEAGYVYYSGSYNDGGSKSITWAVFEKLEGGKRFAVCSTHFFYQSEAESGRVENAKTLVATAKMIADKYNIPVIAGGDLNTKTSSSPFKQLTSNGFTNIQTIAKEASNTASTHAYPTFSADKGYYSYTAPTSGTYADRAIDHALVYNQSGVTFNRFKIVTEELALMSSDHCPLVIDFTFPK